MQIAKYLVYLLFLAPSLAYGLDSLTDQELGDVTAQSGISLTIDDFILYQSFKKISFVDTDGGDPSTDIFSRQSDGFSRGEVLLDNAMGAALNLEDVEIDVLRINAIAYNEDTLTIDNAGKHQAVYNKTTHTFTPKALEIDVVDKTPILSAGYNYMVSAYNNDWANQYLGGLPIPMPLPAGNDYNRVGIVIGLPTIDIYMDELSIGKITVTAENAGRETVNNNASLGKIRVKGLDVAILSGILDFSPHDYSGIDFAPDDVKMYLKIDELKFTDTDGIPSVVNSSASLSIQNIEADLIHINGLTITDVALKLDKILPLLGSTIYSLTPDIWKEAVADMVGEYKLEILSSGQDPAHLKDLNNMLMLDLSDVLKSWHGWPLWIDTTRSCGLTAFMYASNYGVSEGLKADSLAPYAIGGLMIQTGTAEIYVDTLKIGRIAILDEASSQKAANHDSSFFPITIKGFQVDTLNGGAELSSH